MNPAKLSVGALLVAISLFVFVSSLLIEGGNLADPSSPSFFPALLSLIMLVCAIAIGKRGVRPSFPTAKQTETDTETTEESINHGSIARRIFHKHILFFIFSLLLYVYLINYFPFLFLSILYLFVTMYFLNRDKWKTSLVTSVLTAAIIYFVFVYVFKIVFP